MIGVAIRKNITSSQPLIGSFTGHAMLALLLDPVRTVVSTTGGEKNGLVKLTFCKKKLNNSLWVKMNLQLYNANLAIMALLLCQWLI